MRGWLHETARVGTARHDKGHVGDGVLLLRILSLVTTAHTPVHPRAHTRGTCTARTRPHAARAHKQDARSTISLNPSPSPPPSALSRAPSRTRVVECTGVNGVAPAARETLTCESNTQEQQSYGEHKPAPARIGRRLGLRARSVTRGRCGEAMCSCRGRASFACREWGACLGEFGERRGGQRVGFRGAGRHREQVSLLALEHGRGYVSCSQGAKKPGSPTFSDRVCVVSLSLDQTTRGVLGSTIVA